MFKPLQRREVKDAIDKKTGEKNKKKEIKRDTKATINNESGSKRKTLKLNDMHKTEINEKKLFETFMFLK